MSDDSHSGPGSELDDDGQAEVEEMAEVKAKIEAMARDSEERKMAVREWKRLKRIPQGSVEHGVIRNYVRATFFDIGSRLTIHSSSGSYQYHGPTPHPQCRPTRWKSCVTGAS